MRKLTVFGFVAVMALTVAACSSAASPSPASPQPTQTSTATTEPGGTPEATPSSGGGSGTSVEIKGFAFNPKDLTVKVGTKVTWTNMDSAAHTATADDGKTFDSGRLGTGASFSFTFTSAGTFAYHCAVHPSMKATITVQ